MIFSLLLHEQKVYIQKELFIMIKRKERGGEAVGILEDKGKKGS